MLLSAVIGFGLIYSIAAFCCARIPVNNDWKPGNDVTIYLLSNGAHADIVVPVKTVIIDWSNEVKYENTTGNDTTREWVGFGWGEKGFYLQTPTWDDLTFGVAFRAISGMGSSAIHATFHNQLAENNRCRRIKISLDEYKRLSDFIRDGFERTPSGEVIQIITTANYSSHDAFYIAKGRYHLFHTCNTWTINAFKYAGLKTALWSPYASGVLHFY